jgi:glycosyltransferase involved in cell wall biosynthesis
MHEPFIKQAMDGIMMQKTDFKFEVVVGDDFSIDGTLEIIKSYDNTDSIDIKILDRRKGDDYWQKRKKLGRLYNFTNILENCTGKYVALLDGDDYWTDPFKLQKQVNFLEENEEYNLVTSYITQYNQNEDSFIKPKKMKAYSFDYKDMIEKNHSPTCVSVIRNEIERGFELIEDRGTDSQLWLRVLGKNKKAYKFKTSMAVYRKHDGGVSSITHQSHKTYRNRKKYALRKIEKAKFWNNYFDHTANESVKKVKIKIYKYIVSLAKRENKIRDLVFYLLRYFLLKLS